MRGLYLPLTVLTGLMFVTGPAAAQGTPTLADRVHRSIQKGVRYLIPRQGADGGWEGFAGYETHKGGASALITLALLNAGVPDADRKKLDKALEYLRALESDRVYVKSLQTMALAEASFDPQRDPVSRKVDLERIRQNVQWLINARVIRNGRLEGWGYGSVNVGSSTKNASTTQYAVLALWMAKQAGIDIKRDLWESIRNYYVDAENRDGYWIYDPDFGPPDRAEPSITMTTAGLTGLLIAGMELNQGRETLQDGGAAGCGLYAENRPAAKALEWLGNHFTVSPPGKTFYHLYGVERAGRLSGLRFLGEHDWYREGADFLVEKQHTDGSWSLPSGHDKQPGISTSFALLFLSKGRTPVLISKTVHGEWPRKAPGQPGFDLDWNNDRNDLRNLVQFTSKHLFKGLPLAWQTYDLMWAHTASRERETAGDNQQAEVVAEMLQSPVFYITGHRSPRTRFTGTEKKLLKRYVESGGFIFAEACCSDPEFDRGFRGLVEDIWGVEVELAQLDGNHAVWSSHFVITPGDPYQLWGLSLGCKTVLIYSPRDLSCYWESGDPEKNAAADRAFKLGANVLAYATGMQPPRPRLTQVAVASGKPPGATARPRGSLKVGQVWFKGEWQPAPKAMTRVLENVRTYANVDVVFEPAKVDVRDEDVADYKFLYLHGRVKPGQEPFPNDAKELELLRFNLENGGLLFADACCGDENFDKAFRNFIKLLFPKQKLEQVPLNDTIFSKELGGEALTDANIKCRLERRGVPQSMAPWLEGIKGDDGRWMVLYSKYDIGCALEGHQSLGCLGYDPPSALKLARAAILYNLRP
jgi:hypothetical protein